jgi:integrase
MHPLPRRNSPGTGSVDYEPPRQCYRARVSIGRNPDGSLKRLTRRFYLRDYPTAKKAERAARDWVEETRTLHRKGTLLEPSTATLAEWLDEFVEGKRAAGRGKRTVQDYQDVFERHVKPHLGHLRLQALTPVAVQGWVSRLRSQTTAKVVWRAWYYLKLALNEAVRLELLHRNPAQALALPKPEPEPRRRWTAQEAAQALEYAREHDPFWHNYLVIALSTWLRREELLGLRWGWVNPEEGYLDVNGAVVYVKGKPVAVPPKTRDSRRRVWFREDAREAFERQRELVAALRSRPTFQDEDLVFPSVRGGPRSESGLLEAWREFCRAAGVPFIYLYRLRSTAISLAKSTGLPTRIAARRAGHSPAVQMRHYDETEEAEQRGAALSLEEVLR